MATGGAPRQPLAPPNPSPPVTVQPRLVVLQACFSSMSSRRGRRPNRRRNGEARDSAALPLEEARDSATLPLDAILISPGSPIFLPHGTKIKNKLFSFLQQEYRDRGYQEVESPNVYNMKIWETSGHAANYTDNMFAFEIDGEEFGLKPMNCPGHCVIFNHGTHSYRELPLRMAEFGVLHREVNSSLMARYRLVCTVQPAPPHAS